MADLPDEPIHVHSQRYYLYNNHWRAEDDVRMIEYMLLKQEETEEQGETIDFGGMFAYDAYDELVTRFTYHHEPRSISNRIQFLRQRYETFVFVANFPGAKWKVRQEYVKAKDVVWRQMFEMNPFAAAYYYHGKAEYHRLRTLFGPFDNVEETNISVIKISSSRGTIVILEDETELDTVEEEVNSPAIPTRAGVRCKLFDEDGAAHPSEIAPHSEPMITRWNVRSRLENASSSTTCTGDENNVVEAPNTVSPYGSSVASNSPFSRMEKPDAGN